MHATVWRRLVTALLGLWFTAYAAEPAGLVACPMHGGAQGVMAHASHGGLHAMAHASHRDEAATTGAADHAPASSHNQGAHHCTCLGHCCGASVAVFRVEQGDLLVATVRSDVRTAVPRVDERPVSAADHTLPFATAPPVA